MPLSPKEATAPRTVGAAPGGNSHARRPVLVVPVVSRCPASALAARFVRRWKGEATLPHEHCSICETRPSRSLSLFRQSKSEIDTPGKALGTEGSDKRIEVPGAQGLELEEEVKGKKENLP